MFYPCAYTGGINVTRVIINSSTQMSILRIPTVDGNYTGQYTCIGFNNHNHSSANVDLAIGELRERR